MQCSPTATQAGGSQCSPTAELPSGRCVQAMYLLLRKKYGRACAPTTKSLGGRLVYPTAIDLGVRKRVVACAGLIRASPMGGAKPGRQEINPCRSSFRLFIPRARCGIDAKEGIERLLLFSRTSEPDLSF